MARSSFPQFGERLRALFTARGVTNQSAFAREHGFTQAKISRWLRGSVPESEADLDRLARVLGTTRADLLAGQRANGESPPAPALVASDDVPDEIRDIVQELFHGQTRLLTKAMTSLWQRAVERAAKQPPDQKSTASGATIGQEKLRRRKRA